MPKLGGQEGSNAKKYHLQDGKRKTSYKTKQQEGILSEFASLSGTKRPQYTGHDHTETNCRVRYCEAIVPFYSLKNNGLSLAMRNNNSDYKHAGQKGCDTGNSEVHQTMNKIFDDMMKVKISEIMSPAISVGICTQANIEKFAESCKK